MLEETIKRIENIVNNSENLSKERRQQLINLAVDLKKQLNELSETNKEDANSIAGFTSITTYESLKDEQDDDLLNFTNSGLKLAIRKVEATHPQLIKTIRNFTRILSNLGI